MNGAINGRSKGAEPLPSSASVRVRYTRNGETEIINFAEFRSLFLTVSLPKLLRALEHALDGQVVAAREGRYFVAQRLLPQAVQAAFSAMYAARYCARCQRTTREPEHQHKCYLCDGGLLY